MPGNLIVPTIRLPVKMLRRAPKFGAAQAVAIGVAVTGPALAPPPTTFTARNSKAYAVSLASPVTVTPLSSAVLAPTSLLSGTSVQVALSGTVAAAAWRYSYSAMSAPPSLAGASQVRTASASPADTARFRGAPGTVGGYTLLVRTSSLPRASVKLTLTLNFLPASAATRV